MDEAPLSGARIKLDYAMFHFRNLERSIEPDYDRAWMRNSVIDPNWQRTFAPCLDAFITAVRSVPEIIQCCFGHDFHPDLRAWFGALSAHEQRRRDDFRAAFSPHHNAFRTLPLSHARNVSFHRTGRPTYEVQIVGAWGTTYTGTAASPIPTSEIRKVDDPDLQPLIKPRPLEPTWAAFTIDGKPLHHECRNYVIEAEKLIQEAKVIAERIHGSDPVTPPPT